MRSSLAKAALVALAAMSGCASPPPPGWCTPPDAYRMWQADPGRVRILDVRTPEEYVFIGHAPMARNIPFQFLGGGYDSNRHMPLMEPNPHFCEDVRKACQPADTLLVMCSSGLRGGEAAELLRKEGFATVLNIQGGFEGQYKQDCDCAGKGDLLRPGWQQHGLPWTAWINPDQVYARSRSVSSAQTQPAHQGTGGPVTSRGG